MDFSLAKYGEQECSQGIEKLFEGEKIYEMTIIYMAPNNDLENECTKKKFTDALKAKYCIVCLLGNGIFGSDLNFNNMQMRNDNVALLF